MRRGREVAVAESEIAPLLGVRQHPAQRRGGLVHDRDRLGVVSRPQSVTIMAALPGVLR
jgi:hypothetical protein